MTKVKGLAFRSYSATFKRLHGDEAHARMLEWLPSELGDALRMGAILTGGWYPVAWLDQLQVAVRTQCNQGVELTRAIAREAVKEDFRSGVHRLVTLATSPEWLIKSSPRIVGFYYDSGRLVVEDAGAGRAMGRYEGFEGFTQDLWVQLIGGSMGVIELAGAKAPVAKVLAGGNAGDGHMTFTIKWS